MSQKIYTVVDRYGVDECYGTYSTMDKAQEVRKALMDAHGMTEGNWHPLRDKHLFTVNVTVLDRVYPYWMSVNDEMRNIMENVK